MQTSYANVAADGSFDGVGIASVTHDGPGRYSVTYENSYSPNPGLVAIPVFDKDAKLELNIMAENMTMVLTYDGDGNPADAMFNILVVGSA